MTSDEQPPGCPPWCADHYSYPGDTSDLHRSASVPLPLRHRGNSYGEAYASVAQIAEPGYEPCMFLRAGQLPGEADGEQFTIPGRDFAEMLAKVIERLAPATFTQHHALAAQIRASAVAAFGETEGESRG